MRRWRLRKGCQWYQRTVVIDHELSTSRLEVVGHHTGRVELSERRTEMHDTEVQPETQTVASVALSLLCHALKLGEARLRPEADVVLANVAPVLLMTSFMLVTAHLKCFVHGIRDILFVPRVDAKRP